jgi:phage/plasmid-like protein (TIGR03299 family)
MSAETIEWLNENTLIGFTGKFGHAWHFDGESDNHYVGPVPVEDVHSRLFSFEALETPMTISLPDGALVTDESRKVIYRSDEPTILGVHRASYKRHQFGDWLVSTVADLLDDDLQVGSAGLLRGGAVAWVQIEMPDNVETPEGVTFRPHLLAKTSHDGTLATTYGRSITNTVCDNTMAIASAEHGGQRFRIRHTSRSEVRLNDARKALEIVQTMAKDFAAEVAALCAVTVTDAEFDRFLESLVPTPEEDGRGKTIATNKQASLRGLWNGDPRVEPWKNTAFGVLQAVNTASHHVFDVRGDREGRNLTKKMYGTFEKEDLRTLELLSGLAA